MKMIAGSCLRAIANSRRMRAAPRPANISTNDAADCAKNWAPDSFATAFASSVLPVPGGPCRSTPFGTFAPSSWKDFGSRRNSTSSCSSAFASSTPAMSANVTDWSDDGLICCGLVRGITFSIRHIMKISAEKNRIAMTGSQLSAWFWISCANETCVAAIGVVTVLAIPPSAAACFSAACTIAACACAACACAARVSAVCACEALAPGVCRAAAACALTWPSSPANPPSLASRPIMRVPRALVERCNSQPRMRTASSVNSSVANARSRTSMRSSAPWISGVLCSID